MSSSKPCPIPAKTHYDYLLTFRKHITKIYGIEESDKRLKYLIKFENKPIVYTSSSNKELQNYETKLVDFMRECDPDLFTNIAKQFKTKYGYECVSQFTTRGEVKQSLFWDKLKTHWDQQREALRKIKEEKKMEKERERQRKVEEEKIEEEIKTAEDKLGQKYKQAQIIDDVKKIQDFVYKCCNQSQTDCVDSMLNCCKAYLFVYSSSQTEYNFNLESSRNLLFANLQLSYSTQLPKFVEIFNSEVKTESPDFYIIMINNAKEYDDNRDKPGLCFFLDICRMHYDIQSINRTEFKTKKQESNEEKDTATSKVFYVDIGDKTKGIAGGKKRRGNDERIKGNIQQVKEDVTSTGSSIGLQGNKKDEESKDIGKISKPESKKSNKNLFAIGDVESSDEEQKKERAAANLIIADAKKGKIFNTGKEIPDGQALRAYNKRKRFLKGDKHPMLHEIEIDQTDSKSDLTKIDQNTIGDDSEIPEEELKNDENLKDKLNNNGIAKEPKILMTNLNIKKENSSKKDDDVNNKSSFSKEFIIIDQDSNADYSNEMQEYEGQNKTICQDKRIDKSQNEKASLEITNSTSNTQKDPKFFMETEISDTQIMILVPSESLDSYKSMLSSLSPSCRYLSIYLVSSLSFSQKLSSDPLESNIKELQFNDKRTKKELINSNLLSLVFQSKCTEIIFSGFKGSVLAKLIENGREHLSGVRMVRVEEIEEIEETGEADKWLEQISEIEGLAAISLYKCDVTNEQIKKIQDKGILVMN